MTKAILKPSRTPKHFRKEGGRYLFEKRLNPEKGWFALFPRRQTLLLPLRVSSDAEATIEAKRLSEELQNLQLVVSREDRGGNSSPSELGRAARAWMWVTGAEKAVRAAQRASPHTEQGVDAQRQLDEIINVVTDTYRTQGGIGEYLSPFGGAIFEILTGDITAPLYSDSMPVYLRARGRHLLGESTAYVRDSKRWLRQFVEVCGDLPIDKVSRSDVQKYIDHRLNFVKTDSVRRELNTLQSIWGAAAREYCVEKSNPFQNQFIPDQGQDSREVQRASPDELMRLYITLEASKSKYAALIAVLCLTGMRLNEAHGLLDDDYDRSKKIVLVRPNIHRRLKNKNAERVIPVVTPLDRWLDKWLAQSDRGTATSASAVIKRYIQSVGFQFGSHGVRHGFRDVLHECQAYELDIKKLMGWSASGQMIDYYGGRESMEPRRIAMQTAYQKIVG